MVTGKLFAYLATAVLAILLETVRQRRLGQTLIALTLYSGLIELGRRRAVRDEQLDTLRLFRMLNALLNLGLLILLWTNYRDSAQLRREMVSLYLMGTAVIREKSQKPLIDYLLAVGSIGLLYGCRYFYTLPIRP